MPRFELTNGLWLPQQRLEPINIFIDETICHDRTALLQAAFPVPDNIYRDVIVTRGRELLRQLGPQAIEFKGSAIKPGNVGPYREFLRLFTGVSASVGDRAPLYPVVSLDAMATYEGQQVDNLLFNVNGALENLHITDGEHVAGEFSRQMLWLHRHFRLIAPNGFRNEVNFIVDAKHLHAEQTQENRFFIGGQLNIAAVSTLESALSSGARTLFTDARSEMRNRTIGRVARFRFVRSPDEFGLQAADILCHLLYSAIRDAMGIRDRSTEFKVRLLREAMPDLDLTGLLPHLTLVTGSDGRQDFSLTDPSLRSRFQILAVPESAPEPPSTSVPTGET